jgi:hypothetical protein
MEAERSNQINWCNTRSCHHMQWILFHLLRETGIFLQVCLTVASQCWLWHTTICIIISASASLGNTERKRQPLCCVNGNWSGGVLCGCEITSRSSCTTNDLQFAVLLRLHVTKGCSLALQMQAVEFVMDEKRTVLWKVTNFYILPWL